MVLHGDDIYNYKDIRLNFSSNVYNHFDHTALHKYLAGKMSHITNYPEPTAATLEHHLAQTLGINDDEVIVTNGATEAIYLIAQAYRGCRSHILQPTFGEYAEACRINKHEIVNKDADLLWLCNPNNPTGEVISKEIVHNVIASSNQTFIFDQSYARFTDKPLITIKEGIDMKRVFIIHSMTKDYCVPGLRLGYVTGDATLLQNIRRLRMPWSVNSLAIEAAHYLLDHENDYHIDLDMLLSEQRRVTAALRGIGLEVIPSDCHILLCKLPENRNRFCRRAKCKLDTAFADGQNANFQGTAAELKERLAKDHGILIRDASNFPGLTPYHFRIAVQTKEANDMFLNSLSRVIHSSNFSVRL